MRQSLITKPSIFQGLNISKLPLTHRGSLYLIPETRAVGIRGQERFQCFVNHWGGSDESIKFIFGKIDKGVIKGGIHLDYCAVADENFISVTEKYINPSKKWKTIEKRRVKSVCPIAVSGFRDNFYDVECTIMKSNTIQISSEKIIDKVAAILYVSKYTDYGINNVYYIKNS